MSSPQAPVPEAAEPVPGSGAPGAAAPRTWRPLALEPWLLLAATGAPLLPDPWACIVLAALVLAWLGLRQSPRELLVAGSALVLAVGLLAWSALDQEPREADGSVLLGGDRLAEPYRDLWRDLELQARRARRGLAGTVEPGEAGTLLPEVRRHAFQSLGQGLSRGLPGREAVFLLDPDGRALAWAGEGLLHEIESSEIPASGPDFRASFGSVTLLVVEPLGAGTRPWRVMSARSFQTDRLPFPVEGFDGGVPRTWSLVERIFEQGDGMVAVPLEGYPTLVLETRERPRRASEPGLRPLHRAAWGALGFALLALLVLRAVGQALVGGGLPRRGGSAVLPLVVAGGLALGLAAALEIPVLVTLLAGISLAAVGLSSVPGTPSRGEAAGFTFEIRPDRVAGALWGMAAVLGPGLAAWLFQGSVPRDLADALLVSPEAVALRTAFFGAALGLLGLAAGSGEVAARLSDRWAWAALGLLALGGASHDLALVGGPLLLAGGALAGLWIQGRPILSRAGVLAAAVCVAAVASAGAWETAHRVELRQRLEEEALPRLAPPTKEEARAYATALEGYFEAVDLVDLIPRHPGGLATQDLAFLLWKRSPLARKDALSVLQVEARDGPLSEFSFGLPGEARGEALPEDTFLPVWEDRLIDGAAEIRYRGEPWARARWKLYLQPGFRLRGEPLPREVEAGLLAGQPRTDGPVPGLPEPAVYVLYGPDGRVLRSPWDEEVALPAELASGEPAVVETPGGSAWAFSRRGTDGWEVLYLPRLGPLQALERVATHAVGVLLVLTLLLLVAVVMALPRPGFRRLVGRTYRSYSRRLIIVTTALVLLPLLAINVLVVAGAEERFSREQRAAGESALISAQRMVDRYLEEEVSPGMDVSNEANAYLSWLSRVLRHQVNLYWKSEILSSSKVELFTAGVLPKRIPGEIFARLSLDGEDLAARTNRVGEDRYLELYAPLRLGDTALGEEQFIVSMPLLAQEEEVARELAALRRQVLLVTAALFGLLIAVGLRLARSFTEPLMELIEGTRRIASGAPSLGVAPAELELAALAQAIDEMAGRVAEGRRRLVREKQVVERIVDNITSGVVSLDHQRQVMMRNQVAAELLGVEVGQRLDRPGQGHPGPLRDFLAGVGERIERRTVRLQEADGESREWSLVWVPVPGAGEPAALLVVEDVTEVLRGQRLEAWAEMARIIAHEIKNPLTPIRLNAEHVQQVWARDRAHFESVFERCMGNILAQVGELHQIASEFSTYSSILRIERKPDDLVEAMEELVEPYRAAPPEGVAVRFESCEPSLRAEFDRRLLSRAVRNLIENALRATSGGGEVRLRVEATNGAGRISVLDQGPGVPPELLGRIFDPYFSTHDHGTGLGLPIARRVAEEHGGSISARNQEAGGLEVTISLPLE